jgi:phosphoglycolate phosphatase-like HAD superfamily hydrolase
MAGEAVQAVVFDLDGVLVDSEQLWDEVRRGPRRTRRHSRFQYASLAAASA